MQRITSIKEIAKLADCSIATVSNALNNKGRVSQEIREKIFDICRQHGYLPNSAGRNLRRRQNEIIGLMFYPSCSAIFSNVFYAKIMESLEATLETRGYDLLLSGFDFLNNPHEPPRFMRQGKVDGVILLGGFPHKAVSDLHGFGLPLLYLDNCVEGLPVDNVTSDGFNASELIVEHLVGLGHKRIVFMAHSHEDANASQREAGFLKSIEAHELNKDDCPSVRDFQHTHDGYERLKEVLAQPNAPTALIGVNDTLAVELMECLQEDGVSVPGDITVFGYNDDTHSLRSTPQLSTVRIDKGQMGKLGAETILSRIEKPDTEYTSIRMPVKLIHRGSEGPPKA
ncbi:MAG: LacI family DNA-binding transcriptional regulator [Opitutales bacterium]